MRKYHQAAFVYIVNALLFLYTVFFRMPAHSFSKYAALLYYLFYTAGVSMVVIFPYFIYKGYRKFTMVLACVYLLRTILTLYAVPIFTYMIIITLALHALTFYMLARAAWDLRP